MDSDTAVALALSLFAIVAVGALAASFPLDLATPSPPAEEQDPPEPESRENGAGAGGTERLPVDPLVGLGLLLGVVALVVYRLRNWSPSGELADEPETTRERDVPEPAETPDRPTPVVGHEYRAENGVYGAWYEFSRSVRVPNRRSATPKEFADRALEFGFPEDAVTELTRLFVAVRYGHRDVTADVEQRARDALRRIDGGADEEDR